MASSPEQTGELELIVAALGKELTVTVTPSESFVASVSTFGLYVIVALFI